MVRFLVLYERPEDPAAFDKHYNEIHIPLVRQLPGLLGYTVGRNPAALDEAKYYLIAELDWENMEALQAAFASEIGVQTAADVPKFAPTGVHRLIYEVAEA
jgi:uncharacterized protein (TIGR02118 family)